MGPRKMSRSPHPLPAAIDGRRSDVQDSFTYPAYTKSAFCALCGFCALAEVPMSPNEPSWKMLTAFLAVIALSTALFYAGLPPGIAVMPCFLLTMLMRDRPQW